MGKYHVKKGKNGQYHFHLKADNGQIILQSEMYSTKGAAFGGITSCKENSGQDGRYDQRTSTSGQWYFVLKARNGEIIGTSEMYSNRQALEKGIASCKMNGPSAGTQDDTE